MRPGLSSLTSVLLIVLLGASPLVGPVCALLCGHSGGAASRMHGAQEHAADEDAAHEQAAHAGQHTEPHVAPAAPGPDHFPRLSVSPGEPCCAFDISSSVAVSAPRIQSYLTVLQADGVPAARITVYGSHPPSAFPIDVQPRPEPSSGRAPLVLRI